jgi:hypothetical protein
MRKCAGCVALRPRVQRVLTLFVKFVLNF